MGGNLFAAFVLIFIALMTASCKPESRGVLVGTYLTDNDIAKEVLILESGGAFSQKVTIKKTSRSDTVKGSWQYDEVNSWVCLQRYMSVFDSFREFNVGYSTKLENVCIGVTVYFGVVFIEFNDFMFYKKISSTTQ